MGAAVGFIGAIGAIGVGATTVGAIVTNLVVGYALSALASAFIKKPSSGAAMDTGLNITNTDPDAPGAIIIGLSKYAGVRRFHETSSKNRWLHFVNVYAIHEIESVEKIYVDDVEVSVDADGWVTSGPYEGILRIKTYNGTSTQTADPYLVDNSPSFDTTFRYQGLAIACVSAKWDSDVFRGEPVISLLMKGAKIYDPRDDTQLLDDASTWKWSDNAILCAAHYLRGMPKPDYLGNLRRVFGTNAKDSDINWNEIAAEANIADEPVNLKEGGTQKRYTANGVMLANTEPGEGIQSIMKSAAGKQTNSGGILSLRAGAARSPVMNFTQADIIGSISISASRPLAQTYNSVKGQYRGSASNFEPDDAPPFQDNDLVTKDGRESWLDLPLPFTDHPAAAQRIQRIALSENRRDKSIVIPVSLKGIKLRAGDWFTLTLPTRGFVNKAFEVNTWRFTTRNGQNGIPVFGVEVEAQEVDSGIWAWDPDAEHIVTPPPPLDLPSQLLVPPPTLNEPEIVEWRDRALVRLSVIPAPDGPPVKYRFAYRLTGTVTWTTLADRIETTVDIQLDVGRYDFRVQAVAQPYGGISLPAPQPLGYLTWEVGRPPVTGRVTGLELVGGGPNGTFTGRDAIFQWRQGRPNAHGFDLPFGADVDQQDPTFDGYRIEVRTMPILPDWPDGILLREARLTDTRFEYTFEMNYRDSKRMGLRSAQRAFRFGVWQISRYGVAEEYSIPVYIDVENPAPVVPTDLRIGVIFSELRVSFTAPDDPDFEGSVVWASTTPSFDPALVTPIFIGRGNFISYELDPNLTYYVRMAAYDAFIGDYDPTDVPLLNISPQEKVETRSLDVDIPRFSFDGLNIRPNDTGDGVEWDAGIVAVSAGNTTTIYNISAGSEAYLGGELFVYYRDGNVELSTATLLQNAQFSDSVVLAVYRGGSSIKRPDGGTLIDGGIIITATIGAQQLVTGTAVITESAQIAALIVNDGHIANLSAEKLLADSAIINRLYVGENLLIEIDGRPGSQRMIFYEEV